MVDKMTKQIPPGYRKTIGIIPEDWEVKKLGNVFRLKSGETKPDDTRKYGNFPVYGGMVFLGFAFMLPI
ncbi:MAG TPA: hypothetical protein ENH14_01335 [candidate division WOR-3 bacterium]|mgnify:FL=1|uniref:Type I restriction modification DNA specificity domain-containing protein n=1 Tax=candidate division WOR-3 bacterium TaxID=2052148 RepID=A0A7V0LTV4_UNCW3|nr:hypothetical protein [candidate division WOR-3 bacterium]